MIIKVIDDIAFQTNILSLNAAVEAAKDTSDRIETNVKISEESFKMAENVSI